MNALLLPLVCGYFLNMGVGTMMQPSANANSSPPPAPAALVTQGGVIFATQGGASITVQP